MRGFIHWISGERGRFFRFPIGFLLILGGVFSFIPGLGIWMLPLGLIIISIDIHAIRDPVMNLTIKAERWVRSKLRKFRRKKI